LTESEGSKLFLLLWPTYSAALKSSSKFCITFLFCFYCYYLSSLLVLLSNFEARTEKNSNTGNGNTIF
jgi:hypothetical protein